MLSVDLASTPRKVAKFIIFFKRYGDLRGLHSFPTRRSSDLPEFFMFGDGDDDERTDCYLNSLQIRQGRSEERRVGKDCRSCGEGIPLQYYQWDFDQGDLAATLCHDIQYIDAALGSRDKFDSM